MKSKIFVYGACVLALVACNQEKQAPAAITPNSTDDQKFAYMLGIQMGEHAFGALARQMGEYVNQNALIQGARDMVKSSKDTAFKVQLVPDTIGVINSHYAMVARERYEATRPDSATMASRDRIGIMAYTDSVQRSLPIKAADEGVTLPVKIEANTSMNVKFSYLVGMQLGNNFSNIGNQFNTEFEMAYFEMGILDGAKKALDSTFNLQMPKDSLDSIGARFRVKMDSIREEAIKKQREEEEKLKAEVASLRGDTLVNGMPAKMNPAVKVTGISYSGETFGEYANRPLFVFYFSTTCPHCRHAAPVILEIADEFAKDGLTTLAVASGGNPKRGIRTFIDDLKWNDNIKVGWDEHRQFGELYSDGYVPKIYLVNPDGSYKLYGSIEREKDQIKEDIKALLGGKPVEWKLEAPAKADTTKPAAPATK